MRIANDFIASGGSRVIYYLIIAKYLFTKTKGDTYLFKTDIRIIDKDEEFYEYEIIMLKKDISIELTLMIIII